MAFVARSSSTTSRILSGLCTTSTTVRTPSISLFEPHLPTFLESTIITLADWYHLQSPSITGIAAADATLINGQGRYEGGPAVDLAVINVVAGKRYRIRLLNMACDPDFLFSIDGHDLTVIEADGNNVQPVVVNQIHILAGEFTDSSMYPLVAELGDSP